MRRLSDKGRPMKQRDPLRAHACGCLLGSAQRATLTSVSCVAFVGPFRTRPGTNCSIIWLGRPRRHIRFALLLLSRYGTQMFGELAILVEEPKLLCNRHAHLSARLG